MKTLTNLIMFAGLVYLGFILYLSDLLPLKSHSLANPPAVTSIHLPQSPTTASPQEKPQSGFVIPPTDQLINDGHQLEVVRGKVAADGIILLCDHPSATRMVDDVNIKVIAAKTDGIFTYGDSGGARRRIAVYKMQFQLGPELKKFVDHMWMTESGSQLQRPNRR